MSDFRATLPRILSTVRDLTGDRSPGDTYFERPIDAKSIVMTKRGCVPDAYMDAEAILTVQYEIATQKEGFAGEECIVEQEEKEFISMLRYGATATAPFGYSLADYSQMLLDRGNNEVALIGSRNMVRFMETLQYFQGAPIYSGKTVGDGEIFLVGSNACVFTIEDDISILVTGGCTFEKIGMAILDTRDAIALRQSSKYQFAGFDRQTQEWIKDLEQVYKCQARRC